MKTLISQKKKMQLQYARMHWRLDSTRTFDTLCPEQIIFGHGQPPQLQGTDGTTVATLQGRIIMRMLQWKIGV